MSNSKALNLPLFVLVVLVLIVALCGLGTGCTEVPPESNETYMHCFPNGKCKQIYPVPMTEHYDPTNNAPYKPNETVGPVETAVYDPNNKDHNTKIS